MKKAKMLLIAILSFGVIGGVFAFKAHKFTSIPVYSYTKNSAGQGYCTFSANLPYTTLDPTVQVTVSTAAHAAPVVTCTASIRVVE